MADKPFLTDIKTLRERARKHIEQGAITEGYSADRKTVIKLLNEALATEIVCVLRYKRHYFMAAGIHAEGVAAEFLEHANDELRLRDHITRGRIARHPQFPALQRAGINRFRHERRPSDSRQ